MANNGLWKVEKYIIFLVKKRFDNEKIRNTLQVGIYV